MAGFGTYLIPVLLLKLILLKHALMKSNLILFCFLIITLTSCQKYRQNTCQFTDCDSRRITRFVAEEWNGRMIYNNDINKWGIRSLVTGNALRTRIALICGPLNDSFKIINKSVVYSGNLKESCGTPRAASVEEEILYFQPSSLR
jgi:hypothetical protein